MEAGGRKLWSLVVAVFVALVRQIECVTPAPTPRLGTTGLQCVLFAGYSCEHGASIQTLVSEKQLADGSPTVYQILSKMMRNRWGAGLPPTMICDAANDDYCETYQMKIAPYILQSGKDQGQQVWCTLLSRGCASAAQVCDKETLVMPVHLLGHSVTKDFACGYCTGENCNTVGAFTNGDDHEHLVGQFEERIDINGASRTTGAPGYRTALAVALPLLLCALDQLRDQRARSW